MSMTGILRNLMTALTVLIVSGCVTTPPPDYSAFRLESPRSILVLPPTNDSVEDDAPYTYLSTISRPLAEAGYYVFPVAVIDAFMKENGLPTPYEMHAVPLAKIDEIIGADTVLYVNIVEWGQKYTVLSSTSKVIAQARLVSVKSGETLWQGTATAVESSGDGGGGLAGMMMAALIEQVIDSATDRTHDLSRVANFQMVRSANGLLLGPYHTEHKTDLRGR